MWILYKNTFFSPTSEAHFVSRPSRFKLCATVNVILAAAVAFRARFSSSMFCTYWAFSVCLDPSSVETQQFHFFFTSLFVLRQPRPTSPHLSVERLTDAFFSEFELHRVDVSLSWREKKIQYTGLLLICSVFVFRQLRLQGCLLLLITVRPWHLVRHASACICFLAVWIAYQAC